MDTYTIMRVFAASWALVALMLFFIGVVIWAFRPGSRRLHDDIARSIFRNDKRPAPEAAAPTSPPVNQPAKDA